MTIYEAIESKAQFVSEKLQTEIKRIGEQDITYYFFIASRSLTVEQLGALIMDADFAGLTSTICGIKLIFNKP